jgi:hypothetical protein
VERHALSPIRDHQVLAADAMPVDMAWRVTGVLIFGVLQVAQRANRPDDITRAPTAPLVGFVDILLARSLIGCGARAPELSASPSDPWLVSDPTFQGPPRVTIHEHQPRPPQRNLLPPLDTMDPWVVQLRTRWDCSGRMAPRLLWLSTITATPKFHDLAKVSRCESFG